MASNYYNEIDPFCAQWLQNLMDAGHIAQGDIDTRSIEDVRSSDLAGYVQCHFFAGLGGWAYALDLAGWPRDRPVWTGSCPCQPFSAAGKGAGFADERHLWPAWHHLISQCQPAVVFGEQVASSSSYEWVDLVQLDMEAADYAFWSIDLCAASIGAPHGRQRIYWVADADSKGLQWLAKQDQLAQGWIEASRRHDADGCGSSAWSRSQIVEGADGAWRVCPPGVQLLADGLSEGMGQLRALGNAIVPQVAAEFVAAYMDITAAVDMQRNGLFSWSAA